jgi:hypothetical protein
MNNLSGLPSLWNLFILQVLSTVAANGCDFVEDQATL